MSAPERGEGIQLSKICDVRSLLRCGNEDVGSAGVAGLTLYQPVIPITVPALVFI